MARGLGVIRHRAPGLLSANYELRTRRERVLYILCTKLATSIDKYTNVIHVLRIPNRSEQ